MTSELKAAAARANGAKSKGPKTAAGREKSSRNSLAHGLTSRHTILLEVDSRAQFQEMLDDFDATYQPATPAQKKLVDEMVATRWRLDRLWMIETALLDDEMSRLIPADDPGGGDAGMDVARAFRSLADGSQALTLARRYQSTLNRAFEHAYRTLRELQKTGQTKSPALVLQPEPSQPEPAPAPPAQHAEPCGEPAAETTPAPQSSPRLANRRLRNEPTSLRSPGRRRRWLALFRPLHPARRRAA